MLSPFDRISMLGSEIMNTETPIGADQQNPQLPTDSPLAEGQPIIPVGDEVAADERLGLPPHLSGISYHEIEVSADRSLSGPQRFESKSMPAPETALDPKIVAPQEKTADEYQEDSVDIAPSDAPQLHPEVEIIARALDIIGSPNQLSRWMNTSLPALQGQTPYSLMNSEGGRKQVEVVLGRIEHGIY